MTIALLLRLWRETVIIVLLALLAMSAFLYSERGNKIERIKSEYKLESAQIAAEYESKSRQIERENYERTITAVNEYKAREQAILADNADARNAVNSLSDTIDKLSTAADTDAKFRIEYSRTTGNLLKECSGQYSEMAAIADRIANDLRLIQQTRK